MIRHLFAPAVLAGLALLAASAARPSTAALPQPVAFDSADLPNGNPTPTPTPDCTLAWRTVPSPNSGASDNVLTAVAAIGPNEVWAVGHNGTQTLVELWDGNIWRIVASPNPGINHNLTGVAALSSTDIWAVGHYSAGGAARILILHWDGTAWSVVPSPVPGTTSALGGVAVLASNDAWAVGGYVINGFWSNLALHWDGTAWTQVTVPDNGPGNNALAGAVMVAANNVWAVGAVNPPNGGATATTIVHWNGTTWSLVPAIGLGSLVYVSAVGPNDIWTVGYAGPAGAYTTLTGHWNGSSWSQVSSPNNGSGENKLSGVAAVAANDAWAVGWVASAGGSQATILHWDGQAWTLVPNAGAGGLSQVVALTATDVWAVGYTGFSSGYRTLTRHYSFGCPTPPATSTPGASATNTPPAATATSTPSATSTAGPPSPTPVAPTPTPCTIQFSDVDQNHPFYAYIYCLACRGVISGYADGTFRPYNDVTRGQLAKILSNAAGRANAIPSTQQTFADVPNTNPFWLFIERLAIIQAISGYGCGGPGEPCDPQNRPYFRGGASATRGQIAKIADGLAFVEPDPIPSTQQTFADVPRTNPFWIWIEDLAGRGIVSGYPCGGPGEPCDPQNRPYFRWGANTTRAQLAKITTLSFFPGCVAVMPR